MYKVVIVKVSRDTYWYSNLKGRTVFIYDSLFNGKYICVDNGYCIVPNDVMKIKKVS